MILQYIESITGISVQYEGEPLAIALRIRGDYIPVRAMGELRARLIKRTTTPPVRIDDMEVIALHSGLVVLHYIRGEVGLRILDDTADMYTTYKGILDGI